MKSAAQKYWWILLPALLVVLFFVNVSLGSVKIPLSETLKILAGGEPSNPVWKNIFLDFRLTKAVTCMLAGGALALGGLQMQTLFRNPLAGPDVLGLSSGASLAVAILIMAGGFGSLFSSSISIALGASIGCASMFVLVMVISHRIRDNISLLIIGLMIGAVTSSVVSMLQYVSRAEDLQYYLVWSFGSVTSLSWGEIFILGTGVSIGFLISVACIKPLNVWLLGENYARSMGIPLNRARLLIIAGTSILTGVVTAFCGPVAFVGLAVPHLTRLVIDTTNHKILIPAVMMTGGIMMLFCDTISRLPGSDFVLPINAITALVGAPVVIWVIVRSKKMRL